MRNFRFLRVTDAVAYCLPFAVELRLYSMDILSTFVTILQKKNKTVVANDQLIRQKVLIR